MVSISKKDFSKWYNQILELAEIVDIRYPVKGMPVYMPFGFSLLKKLFDYLEYLLNSSNHKQVLFPLLISEDDFEKESEHIRGFKNEVFITSDDERKLIVRPTSETAMYPMLKLWLKSHAQLPYKIHQTCCVYRNETKSTRPLIRGREVFWNEAHTVHENYEDSVKHHKEAVEIYKKFFDSLLINYVILVRPEHDKFPGAIYTFEFDNIMPDGKILQIGTVHNLGQNFSKAYDFKILMRDNKMDYPYQLCYGISMRSLAALISIHGDEKGLVLPINYTQYKFVIIPIVKNENKLEILDYCKKIKHELEQINEKNSVVIDQSDKSSGEKHYYWELKGVPFRIEIGERELNEMKLFIKDRLGNKYSIKFDSLNKEFVNKLEKEFDDKIKQKATELFKSLLNKIEKKDDFKNLKGVGIAGW
ncbi:MAG: proline--tRNA ligase, partial [Candidatus Anstonellales archaeon]